jgi:pyruvate dehydrogenase E2 component (dihydrolipoamide acetyltransferase)
MKVTVNIKMPKWELTMKEGKITRWFKQEGDSVDQGEDLFEVETEKITKKVESPAGGILSQILIQAGKKAPVKVVVAFLTES